MADQFCPGCLACSSGESAGELRTVNACGAMFYGWADRCADCGSRVKTVWAVFAAFPIFPLGSFRVLNLKNSRFLSRRVSLHRGQAFVTWAVGYLLLALGLGVWAWTDYPDFKGVVPSSTVGCALLFPALMLSVLASRALSRFVGSAFSRFLGYVLFFGSMVAACIGLWGYLDFFHWPEEVQLVCASWRPWSS